MALELNTDGNTQTSTTGDTAINNSGIYNATLLGATFLWCAGFFGAYVAFTRVVTGVAIDIVGGAKIDIFGGYKLEAHGSIVTKFVRGNHYTWDVAQKCETAAQKIISDGKKTELAASVKRVINDEINVYAEGLDLVAGGDIKAVCTSHSTTCTGDIKLASGTRIQIEGTDLKLIGSTEVVLTSYGGIQIIGPKKITIGGAFVNIG